MDVISPLSCRPEFLECVACRRPVAWRYLARVFPSKPYPHRTQILPTIPRAFMALGKSSGGYIFAVKNI